MGDEARQQIGIFVDENGNVVDLGLPFTASAKCRLSPQDVPAGKGGGVMPPDPLSLAARVVALEDALKSVLSKARTVHPPGAGSSYQQVDVDHALWEDLRRLLATPSPAAEAVREVVRATARYLSVHRASPGKSGPGWQRMAKAVDHLHTNFPALAAGLEEKS